jgi:Contractile injection system tube protein
MTTLTPAKLTRLKQIAAKGKNGKPSYEVDPQGSFEVQFNPTSLKITRSNNIDKGGGTTKTQKRQTPSVQPATLSFDLEFDTAEGDASGQPLDVRELTHVVRQFTEPTKEKPKETPPAVRFEWGKFQFSGIVTQLTEDLDYFSPTGMPLRAKVSVTITEQNPEWEAGAIGPGARDARAARRPGATPTGRPSGPGGASAPAGIGGAGPGAGPDPDPVTTALAKAGESVQQLLARLDQDPATWRTAMAGLQSPLALTAGAQVQLGAGVSASAGLGAGAGAGFTASAGVGATASLEGALGVGVSGEVEAGFVLAASGGVAAATTRVAALEVAAASGSARAAFVVPPLTATVSASVSASAALTPDPRSLAYGRGIPLRARVTLSGDAAATRRR